VLLIRIVAIHSTSLAGLGTLVSSDRGHLLRWWSHVIRFNEQQWCI